MKYVCVICYVFGVLRPTRLFFIHIGDVASLSNGINILPILGTQDRCAIGILACHTYYDNRHPFIKVIFEYP